MLGADEKKRERDRRQRITSLFENGPLARRPPRFPLCSTSCACERGIRNYGTTTMTAKKAGGVVVLTCLSPCDRSL